MLTLHLEAPSYDALLRAAEEALGIKFTEFASTIPPSAPAPQPAPPSPEAAPPAVTPLSPAAASGAEPQKRKAGRPRKEQAPAGAPVTVPASQATVDNGASAPAATLPAAEGAIVAVAGAAQAASAPVDVDFDKMKSKLQQLAALKVNGDKDDNAGLMRASQALAKHGFRKVKEVTAEKFGAVYATAQEMIAAAAS